MSQRHLFKRFDDRTGRLERAISLVEDGEKRGVYTARGESDPKHPLGTPKRIGPDRAFLRSRLPGTGRDNEGFTYTTGYTGNYVDLWEVRQHPSLSWGSGGVTLTALESYTLTLGSPIGLLLVWTREFTQTITPGSPVGLLLTLTQPEGP